MAGTRARRCWGRPTTRAENNQPASLPTTDETLRRQVLWALTSGSPGSFSGSSDWKFGAGWENRLDTPAGTQLQKIRDLFAARSWWTLVPDEGSDLVTAGRGTELTRNAPVDVLENDYATAARAADGSWAVVYVPTARRLTLAAVPRHAAWIDPADATGPRRPAVVDGAGHLSTPGRNSAGASDWLLLIES